jgi:superfamily II DNA or RNA helicase
MKSYYTDAMTWLPYSKELEDRYTFTSRFDERIKLCVRDITTNLLGVPRGTLPIAEDDRRALGQPVQFFMRNPPRNDTQAQKIQQSVSLLKGDRSHIFRASTGFGKTYCALSIAQAMGRGTLVVVTKDDLMAQWKSAILTHTDIKASEIGCIQQDVCDYEGKKITLAMVHSLSKDKYGEALKDYFGLVIFDEVHRMAAETFSTACTMFSGKYRLGLSATPQRIDGKDPIFIGNIGPVLVQTDLLALEPVVYLVQTGWKPYRQLWYSMGKMMPVYSEMARDPNRNELIVKYAKLAWSKGRRVIVFSDIKGNHLKPLFAMAKEMGVPAEDMAFYVGGMSEKQREEAKTKKVLWATYSMAAEATDIPWLDTAILATPRANVTQPIGRILREWEGKPIPLIIDLVDAGPEELRAFAGKRTYTYRKMKASITNVAL